AIGELNNKITKITTELDRRRVLQEYIIRIDALYGNPTEIKKIINEIKQSSSLSKIIGSNINNPTTFAGENNNKIIELYTEQAKQQNLLDTEDKKLEQIMHAINHYEIIDMCLISFADNIPKIN